MIKANIKTMDNLTEEQLKKLIDGLKRIDGFQFFISSGILLNQ